MDQPVTVSLLVLAAFRTFRHRHGTTLGQLLFSTSAAESVAITPFISACHELFVRLLFFTDISVDNHGIKIVPQTIDKSLFRMYFYPRSAKYLNLFPCKLLSSGHFSIPATHPLFWHPVLLPFSFQQI